MSDGKGRELVPDEWRAYDDTLADGDAPRAVPAEVRSWLGEQRFVHGLLRSLWSQDALAREARVDAILARIDRESAATARWRWPLVAAAALLLACAGVWMALPPSLPTAQAAVERAVAELARDVARRYRLELTGTGERSIELALVTRPGGRFVVDGKLSLGPFESGPFRLGADGEQFWAVGANGMFRRAVPAAQRDRLLREFGDIIDLGYLDVHDLVRKLPDDFELRVVGRERDAAGRSLLRLEANRRQDTTALRLRTAWLLCDEATGMVTRLVFEFERRTARSAGTGGMTLEYLGEEPPGLVDFGRPW